MDEKPFGDHVEGLLYCGTKTCAIESAVQKHNFHDPKFGIATIWDADILIWASTQITEALDRGITPSRVVHFHPHNMLKSIRRPTGGEHYLRPSSD